MFDDVYSVETLPAPTRGLLACDLDPSYGPGTHWVAIYVDQWKASGILQLFGREPCKTAIVAASVGRTALASYRA